MPRQTHLFRGRAILPAHVHGRALVTRIGFNTLACLHESLLSGKKEAVCSDPLSRDLLGRVLTDKILCLPGTIGSTSAGAVWDGLAAMGLLPKAMLFSEAIDSLAAAGLIVADIWSGVRVCTVDRLGPGFLKQVNNNDSIEIREDGTVLVEKWNSG